MEHIIAAKEDTMIHSSTAERIPVADVMNSHDSDHEAISAINPNPVRVVHSRKGEALTGDPSTTELY